MNFFSLLTFRSHTDRVCAMTEMSVEELLVIDAAIAGMSVEDYKVVPCIQEEDGEQKETLDTSNDEILAREYQENGWMPVVEVDARLADAVATHLRKQEEEELTTKMLYSGVDGIVVQDGWLIYTCPHCGQFITTSVNEINCTIFRHGITEAGQIGQHLSEEQAQATLASNAKKYGCGKQYLLERQTNGNYRAVTCTGR